MEIRSNRCDWRNDDALGAFVELRWRHGRLDSKKHYRRALLAPESAVKEDMNMTHPRRMWAIALLSAVIAAPAVALAVPKGPGGQTCKSSGTTTVNGKEEGTGKA